MPPGRIVGFASIAALVVLGLLWGYWPRAVLVDTATAMRGPLRVTVEEEGRTRVRDRYVVSASVPAYARRIELDVGDAVEAREVIVELEPLRSQVLDPRSRAEAQARVAAARSTLARARDDVGGTEAEAQEARLLYERRKALCEIQCVSQEEVDQAEARMRRTEADLRAAEHAVEVARYELEAAITALEYSAATDTGAPVETVTVRAPVAGRVLKVHRESEGVVTAGEPLIELGDPRNLEVEVDVLSKDAVRIAPGTPVLLERWGGSSELTGEVRVVEPTGFTKVSALGVEEQRVLLIADIVSPPEDWARLGDGYRVEAVFIVWEHPDVLQVPASALFRYDDAWAVFKIEAGRARRTPVTIGQSNGLTAEITGGLAVGDRVIVHPDDEIEDGRKVTS